MAFVIARASVCSHSADETHPLLDA